MAERGPYYRRWRPPPVDRSSSPPYLDIDQAVRMMEQTPAMPAWWPVMLFWAEIGRDKLNEDNGG